jgi:hypothetical protein
MQDAPDETASFEGGGRQEKRVATISNIEMVEKAI